LNPDIRDAVDRLAAEGVIPAGAAPRISRIARGDLVSVRLEIRALLYAGVTLAVAGAGLFVKEHYREIGPVAITLALSLAAAGCLVSVARGAPPFTWERAPAGSLASQYVLILGVLLLGADLAYVESQFRVLGPEWPYHLLLYSVIALFAAYRFDSAAVLSLALSAFAAWRGVEVKDALGFLFRDGGSRVRMNAIGCGLLFLAEAAASARGRLKAHFETVWGNLGCLLLFGGLLSGALGPVAWTLWDGALLVACAAVLALAVRAGREAYAAQAIVAGYLGAMRFVLHPVRDDKLIFLLVAASASVTLWVLVRLHRRMQGRHAA
jgi:hypothetical protein